MEQSVPAFMQYGAMGILAMAFIILLVLYIRSDKRSQMYADRLDEAAFDRSQLIHVVTENTTANLALAGQIAEMNKTQDRTTCVIEKLDRRLAAVAER